MCCPLMPAYWEIEHYFSQSTLLDLYIPETFLDYSYKCLTWLGAGEEEANCFSPFICVTLFNFLSTSEEGINHFLFKRWNYWKSETKISQPINNPVFCDPEPIWIILCLCLPLCENLEIILGFFSVWTVNYLASIIAFLLTEDFISCSGFVSDWALLFLIVSYSGQSTKSLCKILGSWWYCSVTQSCLTLCDPMDYSTPGFPALHYLPEFAQMHGHWVNDAIQPFQLNNKTLTSEPELRISREMVCTCEILIFSKPSLGVCIILFTQHPSHLCLENNPCSFRELWSPHSNMVLGEMNIFSLGHRSWSSDLAHDPNQTN